MGEICSSVFSDGYKSAAHTSSTQHPLEAHGDTHVSHPYLMFSGTRQRLLKGVGHYGGKTWSSCLPLSLTWSRKPKTQERDGQDYLCVNFHSILALQLTSDELLPT